MTWQELENHRTCWLEQAAEIDDLCRQFNQQGMARVAHSLNATAEQLRLAALRVAEIQERMKLL